MIHHVAIVLIITVNYLVIGLSCIVFTNRVVMFMDKASKHCIPLSDIDF